MAEVAGEKVSVDEPLVELETDKVNVEVPSPVSGYLESIAAKEGETVNVGSLLVLLMVQNQAINKNDTSEISDYSPPKKTKEEPN